MGIILLTSIVLFFALFFTIFGIIQLFTLSIIAIMNKTKKDIPLIWIILACFLWSCFYFLTHYIL